MGLDSFWKLPEGAETPVFERDIHLCGGMMSANGVGSFRGKVYNFIIEAVTGVSLYQEEIDNETVMRMAVDLANTTFDEATQLAGSSFDYFDVTEAEYKDLIYVFSVYAHAGASLNGWW